MKQIYRFSSTLSNSKLKSSLCVVGPIATKVSRTIIPDLDPEVMIKNGHKSIEESLKFRQIGETQLFGMKTEEMLENCKKYVSLFSRYENVKYQRQSKSNSELKVALFRSKFSLFGWKWKFQIFHLYPNFLSELGKSRFSILLCLK